MKSFIPSKLVWVVSRHREHVLRVALQKWSVKNIFKIIINVIFKICAVKSVFIKWNINNFSFFGLNPKGKDVYSLTFVILINEKSCVTT